MKLLYLSLIGSALITAVSVKASCVTNNNNAGCLHFEWKTNPATDQYTNLPTTAQQQWFQQHFYRIVGYSPYWDSRLSWFPSSWFYLDSSSIYTGSTIAQRHPEFILRNASGTMLYINYGCSNGTCPQYAPDYSNEGFRQWWIAEATSMFNAGYTGIFIDDVNLVMNLSNGSSVDTPIDPNTGMPMPQQAWESYFASFLSEVRRAFPTAEICHNALWYAGNANPNADASVAQEIRAANYINLERGFDDGGLSGDGGLWSVQNFMTYIDTVHSMGTKVLLEQYGSDNTNYALAGYFLISSGGDLFADDSVTPAKWWSGYDLDIGSSRNSRYVWNNLFRRDFQNGMVLLNPPGRASVTVLLASPMTDLSGNVVTSVTLAASTGAVLLGNPVIPIQGPVSDGIYTLRNVYSGWVLDDPAYSTASGTQITQWASNGGNNQKWVFTSDGNGHYTIKNYYSGLYLTAQSGKLIQSMKNNSDVQLWSVVGSGSIYALVNKGVNQVIDDPAFSITQGTGMDMWSANGGLNQKWKIQ